MAITTEFERGLNPAVRLEANEETTKTFKGKPIKQISFMPSANETYTFWYRGRYVWVTQFCDKSSLQNTYSSGPTYTLSIRSVAPLVLSIRSR
jgi:hypothetical protein